MTSTFRTITATSIAASLILLSGCAKKPKTPAKPVNYSQQAVEDRSQELIIIPNVITKKNKEETQFQYTIELDNVNKNKAALILKNRGDKTLHISNIKLKSITGDVRKFKMSNNCNTKLLGGDECTLNINFASTSKGKHSAVIEIQSDDISNKITNVLVNGDAKDKFHASINKIASVAKTAKKSVELKFNALNKMQHIEIKNDGLELLKLNPPKRSGADASSFSYTTTCKKTLAVGEKCELTVKYDPTKKEGYSDATIKIPSNGKITPSQYIRLEGYSKPFTINLNNFVVSKNVNNFIDDYFESTKTYYVRTIYQGKTDRFFSNGIKKEIKNYFKANNFRLASSAAKADRIITLYPSVIVTEKEGNDLQYNIVVNGQLTTKAKDSLSYNPKSVHEAKDAVLALDYESDDTKFTAIAMNKVLFDKEKFQFGLDIGVDNVSDDKEVASTVADIVVSKLFNVLGLKDTKGNI